METPAIEKEQKTPLIINLKKEPKCLKEIGTLYIGRSKNNPNHFGNPFSHIKSSKGTMQVKSREEAVSEFEKEYQKDLQEELELAKRTKETPQIT